MHIAVDSCDAMLDCKHCLVLCGRPNPADPKPSTGAFEAVAMACLVLHGSSCKEQVVGFWSAGPSHQRALCSNCSEPRQNSRQDVESAWQMLLEMTTLAHLKYRPDCALQVQVVTFIHQQCAHIRVVQTEQSDLNLFQVPDARRTEEMTPGSELILQEQCTLAANGQQRSCNGAARTEPLHNAPCTFSTKALGQCANTCMHGMTNFCQQSSNLPRMSMCLISIPHQSCLGCGCNPAPQTHVTLGFRTPRCKLQHQI